MGKPSALYVRRAILTRLKAQGSATRAVVGERSYGPKPPAKPTFPFTRYGAATIVPMRATGLDGSRVSITINGFAKGSDDGAVSAIEAAVVADLDRAALPLDAPFPAKLVDVSWEGTTHLQDRDNPEAWQAVMRFAATVVS